MRASGLISKEETPLFADNEIQGSFQGGGVQMLLLGKWQQYTTVT